MRLNLARTRWKLKYLITIPLALIIIFNIQLISQIREFNGFKVSLKTPPPPPSPPSTTSEKQQWHVNRSRLMVVLGPVKNTKAPAMANELKLKEQTEIENLKRLVDSRNDEAFIRNRHFINDLLKTQKFMNNSAETNSQGSQTTTNGIYQAPDFIVILVQVHTRISYLRELIASLKETMYIEQALVVFSHDIFDHQMNELVESIDFCATLQIFYPFSEQLNPKRFPGKSQNDCPKNTKKSDNAAYPDTFGNYRESAIVQIKHHWTWKLEFVFEQLKETNKMENLHVLLLEEDHYLMPDSIHILRKLTEKILSDIDVISLGIFQNSKQNLEMKNLNKYAKAIWHSSSHNTGLFITRPQWNMIKDCFHAFCTFDDYNWDWSLQYISQKCFKLPLVAIFPVSSRVIHIGTCGTHHKDKNCDPKDMVLKLKQLCEENKEEFFQNEISIESINTAILKVLLPNGGWSDPRDHELCKNFFYEAINLNNNATTSFVNI